MSHNVEPPSDSRGKDSTVNPSIANEAKETTEEPVLTKTRDDLLSGSLLASDQNDLVAIPPESVIRNLRELLAIDSDRYFEVAKKALWVPLEAAMLRLPHKQEHRVEINRIVEEAFQKAHDRLPNYDTAYILRLDLWDWLYHVALDVYFNWLPEAFGPTLREYIAGVTRNQLGEAEVEDVLQETLVNALRNREKHGSRDLLPRNEGWLKVIARNECYQRIGGDKPELLSLDTGKDGQPFIIMDKREPFDEAVVNADHIASLMKIIYDCIEELPEKYRKVLELHKLKGFTQQETADKLGLKVGTVKSQVKRGLEQLKTAVLNKLRDQETKR